MLFDSRATFAFSGSLVFIAGSQLVVLLDYGSAGPITAQASVRMDISGSIDPRPPPYGIVDKQGVAAPNDSAASPAPRSKRGSNRNSESKMDCATDKKARPRSGIHN